MWTVHTSGTRGSGQDLTKASDSVHVRQALACWLRFVALVSILRVIESWLVCSVRGEA